MRHFLIELLRQEVGVVLGGLEGPSTVTPEESACFLRDSHLQCAKGRQDRSTKQYRAASESTVD